jgi:hypothetical protein
VEVSFLFWNLKKQSLGERVAKMAQHENVEIIMLAECDDTQNIQSNLGHTFRQIRPYDPKPPRVHIFAKTNIAPHLYPQNEGLGRTSVWRLTIPSTTPILIALAHWVSKNNSNESDQLASATEEMEIIRTAENDAEIQATVLVGDLNMNPYEAGMMSANGVHGMMTIAKTTQNERMVRGRSYQFFYNPMWGLFGDRTPGPPGTYHYNGDMVTPFWNIFDQVLLRPSLVQSLRELRILDSDGDSSLLTNNGIPDSTNGSDHLPILFRLEI